MGMGAALALFATAGCLGAWVLRAVRAEAGRPVDSLLAALAVGNGLLGACGLGLAALHVLEPVVVWPVTLALAAPGARRFGRLVHATWTVRPRMTGAERVLLVTMGVYLAALLVMVLAPSITGDQTKYQLAYPKLYAAAGGLVETPWTFWGQQQFLENFTFGVAFAVGSETTAHLLHAGMGLVAIAATARLVGRWLAPGWQWAAAALVATEPMIWSMFQANGADLPVVAYTVLAVAALIEWMHADAGGLRRAALLAGLAGGTKVMGLLTPALVGGGAILYACRNGVGRGARVAVVFACLAAPMAAGPYVRNAVEVGDPLHPFGYGLFHGTGWSREAGAYLAEYYRQYRTDRAHRRGEPAYEGTAVLRFPWDLTLYPESFERSARSALDVGPFMLAALPAAVCLAVGSVAGRAVVLVGAAYVAIIAGGLWAHPRYVLPGLVLLVAAGLGGVARLFDRRLVAAIVGVTVLGQLALTARVALPTFPDELSVAIGATTRATFLARHSGRYRFWRAVDAVLPPAAGVLVLGKIPHPYFIDRPFVLGSYLEQVAIDYRRIDDPDELLAAARRQKLGYVAFETADLARHEDPFERRVVTLWRRLRDRLGPALVREGGYELYRVPGGPHA
jgi:hypothetical protein